MRNGIAPAVTLVLVLVLSGLLGLSSVPASASPPASVVHPLPSLAAAPAPPRAAIQVAPGFIAGPGVADLGAVAPATAMDAAVGLAFTNESALAAYLDALYVPGTPAYHHFLSTAELASRYGASGSALATATAYFQSYGLRVTVSPDHLLLSVDGTAAQFAPAFGTAFDEYRNARGAEFVSHPTPAELPSIVGWTGVLGLGNATSLTPAVTAPTQITPAAVPDTSCSGSGDIKPCQVWGAYNMSPTAPSTDGAGETIGVVDAYDDAQTELELKTDLADFDSAESLPAPTVNYMYPVGPTTDINTTSTGWGPEESLDLEWSHASAPGATIDMTFSPNPNVGLYQAVDYLVAHQSVNVISMSWGEPDSGEYNAYAGPCALSCNASSDGSYALLGPVLEFAAAEGISVLAATGDCGAADGTSGDATNFPASNAYVTAVGGTYLDVNSTGTWEGETGWSGNATGATAPGCGNQGGSGGGFSPLPAPWWQSGEGFPTDAPGRGVPDVSAIATPGVVIYYNSGPAGVGGTSLATPIWAGIAALADQAAGTSLGLLNPTLYNILRDPSEYAADFHDITEGNNGYLAGKGWDPVTGIGTPIVDQLIPSLTAGPTALTTLATSLGVSSSSGPVPLTVTFSVGASGGSGSYPAEGIYFGDGNASFVTGGQIEHTFTGAGVYSVQAYAVDSSGNYSISLPVAVVVGGGSALGSNLSVNNDRPSVDAPITFTATATGGTAPDRYLYYFGDGTYQNWSDSPTVEHSYGATGSFCATVLIQDSADPVDGGVSLPVPVGVGSAGLPVCASSPAPLSVTANSTEGTRDAPADFPALFGVSGGAGTISEQYRSTDPYVVACGCAIVRSPGPVSISLYANESIGASAYAEVNLTVAPALNVSFTASPTFGPAPLVVTFGDAASGGYGANASNTSWSFGNGDTAVGASVQETYSTPGTYWAIGHLSDRGQGNASEAFLIDVGPSSPSAAPYLTGSVSPAIDIASGATVTYAAQAYAWNGTRIGANYTWQAGGRALGYVPDLNETYYAPSQGAASFVEDGNLSATFATTGSNQTDDFSFPSFYAAESGGFVPATNALMFSVTGGPWAGAGPLYWSAVGEVAGPGSLATGWAFGDGTTGTGVAPAHTYWTVGLYTLLASSTDSWGDRSAYAAGIDVTSTGVPLALVAGPSVEAGPAPLPVTFTAVASGGSGAPYSYAWEFGDGGVASAPNVTHTYETAGSYLANVTAYDSHGTAYSRSYEIVVSAPVATGPVLGFIPRSFTLALFAITVGIAVGAVLAVAFGRPRTPARSTP
jgi:PKD repeat protein